MGTVLGGFLFSEHCLLLNLSKTFFQDSEEVCFFFFVRFYTFTAALSAFRFVGSLFGEKNILQCQVGHHFSPSDKHMYLIMRCCHVH